MMIFNKNSSFSLHNPEKINQRPAVAMLVSFLALCNGLGAWCEGESSSNIDSGRWAFAAGLGFEVGVPGMLLILTAWACRDETSCLSFSDFGGLDE